MRIILRRGCATEMFTFVAIAALICYGIRSELFRQKAAYDDTRVWAQLSQLISAVHAHASVDGELPPLSTVSKDSGEGLSWRVLILPHLGENGKTLYEKFDLTKSWDAPTNLALLSQMPDIFARLGDQRREGKTYCCAVHVDRNWNGGNQLEATTGSASALLLAESKVSREWTRPRDIELAPDGQAVHTVVLWGQVERSPIGMTRNGQKLVLIPGVEWNSHRYR